MSSINFNNKKFKLLDNSLNGQVNNQTTFEYKQEGDLVTADYHGGTVVYGKIIAQLKNKTLHMLYNCLTAEKELKAGKATGRISLNKEGKILMHLDWQWLESEANGNSIYIEI